VPSEEAERAAAALVAYLRENRPQRPSAPSPTWSGDGPVSAALAVSGALLAFFLVTGPWASEARWFARGAAEADRMLSGEPWRAVIALTLHADVAHVFANALAGALFLGAVFSVLGPGLGGVLVLLAGAAGNLANAVLRGADHASVGASTAVFGAVGILAGVAVVRRRLGGHGRGRAWLPAAAGLALFGMLGTGGERTDVSAHLLGLAAGLALGALAAMRVKQLPGLVVQWLLGGLGLAIVLAGWAAALRGPLP
jgi:membrane associated rhomboid family serine protease